MKLTIIGAGYVGLVTGVGFANLGNDVLCLDVDKSKIDRLKQGELTIFEPGLNEIYERNLKNGRIQFTTDEMEAIESSDIIFICVGTPIDENNQEADLSYVKSAAESIGRHMNRYKIVVNKSTVPVGTAEIVRSIIKEVQTDEVPFDMVSSPEFLREGAAVKDFENPDRIIIGVDSKKAEEIMMSLYRSIARTERPVMVTGIKTAEIIKYAANAMLATRISFVNQLSHLCEKTGADIKDVSRGLGLDKRIGSRFLHAGIGYGGSCFPKDIKALIATLKQYGCDADLFEAVHKINEKQKAVVVDKLEKEMDINGKTVALWGISFKPKTDDIRDAPSLSIIKTLREKGASVHAFDPVAMDNARKLLPDVQFFSDPYKTAEGCDALIVVTEWDEFRNIDMPAVKKILRQPVIIDGRNIYDPEEMRSIGFKYFGIGR